MTTMRIVSCVALLAVACGEDTPAATPATPAGEASDPFTDYKRKSMTTEVLVTLKVVARSLADASLEPEIAEDGTTRPRTLLAAPMTPAAGSCCKQPGQRCAVDRAALPGGGYQVPEAPTSENPLE